MEINSSLSNQTNPEEQQSWRIYTFDFKTYQKFTLIKTSQYCRNIV